MEEAAMDWGENAWWTFWRVTFPLAVPGIVASLLRWDEDSVVLLPRQ